MQIFSTLNKVYSYQFRNYGIKKILSNQIRYHKKNYSKYFALKQKEFKGKFFVKLVQVPVCTELFYQKWLVIVEKYSHTINSSQISKN